MVKFSTGLERPLWDALSLIARRPLLPPSYMALLLKQDPDDLWYRLRAGVSLGWLQEELACCGQDFRYELTEAGRIMLKEISNEA